MKKFMKGCAYAALFMIGIGLVLVFVGGTIEGRETISEVVEKATDGKVQMKLNSITDWGLLVKDDVVNEVLSGIEEGAWIELNENVNYDIDDAMIFDDLFEIFTEDVELDFDANEIDKLDVEVGGCDFVVKESDDAEFHVDAENAKKFQGYVKDGTLYIKATTKTVVNEKNNTCNIILSVPAEYHFDKIDMEVGAGAMEFCEMAAESIELEVGAGKIEAAGLNAESLKVAVGMGEVEIDQIQVKKLDAEVGMGNFEATGDVSEKVIAECAMGNITLELAGAEKDYDYSIECGLGNVNIGDNFYSGITSEKEINNGADRKMEVECAVGNIVIGFGR